MNAKLPWGKICGIVGGIAMLVGGIDPLEGSLLILPGSGLLALGEYMDRPERRTPLFRVWMFGVIAVGVGALWLLSMLGGIGGKSGLSAWWGLLLIPYPIAWSVSLWHRESPRWLAIGGIVVGLWYLAIFLMSMKSIGHYPDVDRAAPDILLSAVGAMTLVGCERRLTRKKAAAPPPPDCEGPGT